MFTDMVDYTAVTQHDEALALNLLERQNGLLLPLVRAHGGTPVKTIGDALLAEFDSALEAVNCGVEIQRRVKEYNDSSRPAERFQLRIGIHVGDVIHKEGDVFGDAINIASRIQPLADPGGVCISQQVYDQVANKVDFGLERLPTPQLKNVATKVEVYRVQDRIQPGRWGASAEAPDSELPRERVAVLPLANYSPSAQDEYLADGMTEELITAISGVRGLRVIARSSVMRFRNSRADVAEIGRVLRAGSILEGSFRKAGERIRVTVQLVDSKTEEHIWASNYDGDMKDIFSIQSDIATRVAEALRGKLLAQGATGPSRRREVDIESYELYLKGRYFWNRRNAEGVTQALKLFRAAAEKDPGFAKVYSGIADCYLIGDDLSLFKHQEAADEARKAIETALNLDDSVAEAHASLGLLLNSEYTFSAAEKEFKKALSLNESYASAHHWYAICLANLGRLDDAIKEATIAGQSDPLSPPAKNILGVMYTYARRLDDAMKIFEDTLKLDSTFLPALQFRHELYLRLGMEKEALGELEQVTKGTPAFDKNEMIAYTLLALGRNEEAKTYLQECERTVPAEDQLFSLRALPAAIAGDADEFFKWAEPALKAKTFQPADIRYAYWLDKMRSDPRFQRLLEILPG